MLKTLNPGTTLADCTPQALAELAEARSAAQRLEVELQRRDRALAGLTNSQSCSRKP